MTTNTDLLQERTSRLIKFVHLLIIALMGLAFFYCLFDCAGETQAIKQTELDKQLSRCFTGSHCKVGTHEFLTITAGRGE